MSRDKLILLRLGTPIYRAANPDRIAVYNDNYDFIGLKTQAYEKPWAVTKGWEELAMFGTAEEAWAFVREELGG